MKKNIIYTAKILIKIIKIMRYFINSNSNDSSFTRLNEFIYKNRLKISRMFLRILYSHPTQKI